MLQKVSIGAGFGLMSLSVIVADCVMLHCTKNKSLYQKIKELDIKDDINNQIELEDVEEGDDAHDAQDAQDVQDVQDVQQEQAGVNHK